MSDGRLDLDEWVRDDRKAAWLAKDIAAAQTESPRSQQRELGPSEIGTPCQRKLALKVVHAEHVPLPVRKISSLRMFVGTAVHDHIAQAVAARADQRPAGVHVHPEVRVVAEEPSATSPGLAGTADLVVVLDRFEAGSTTALVWDLKVVGERTLEAARGRRVDPTYQVQVDLYGLGVARAMHVEVASVGIIFVPAAGELNGIVAVHRPWSRQRAEAHLGRWHSTRRAVARRLVDVEDEARLIEAVGAVIEATAGRTADDHCDSCPFLDVAWGDSVLCRGHQRPGALEELDLPLTEPKPPATAPTDPFTRHVEEAFELADSL